MLQVSVTAVGQLLLAIALAGDHCVSDSKSRESLLLAGESHFCRCYNQILLFTLAGNLIFAGVINQILLFTLAGEFLTGDSRKRTLSKKMQIDKLLRFCMKSDKDLLFHIKK